MSGSLADVQYLREELERIKKSNDQVEFENRILYSYLQHHRAEDDDDGMLGSSDPVTPASPARRRRGRKAAKIPTRLTVDYLLEVAQSEFDEAVREKGKLERNLEEQVARNQAKLEETNLRLQEVGRELLDFNKQVIRDTGDEMSGKVYAEKIVKWMQVSAKRKQQQVQKISLKTKGLQRQRKQLYQQLKDKYEMGDVLHYIDFHQLQIENKQYMARIEEKNAQLLQLKASTSRAVQHLNGLKRKLKGLLEEQAYYRKDIRSRTDLLQRLRKENQAVVTQIESQQRAGERLDAAVEEGADLPRVLDYVRTKSGHYERDGSKKSWARKLEIAEMAARQAEARLRTARRAAVAAKHGAAGSFSGRSGAGGTTNAAGLSATRLLEEDPAAALELIAGQLEAAAASDGRRAGRVGRAGASAGAAKRTGVAGAPVRTVAGARGMGGRGQLLAGSLRQYNPAWGGTGGGLG